MKTMQKKSGSGWIVAAAVALALLPGACFNPLNDAEDGMGTIDFGVSNALALVGPAEAADLRYDLVLSGPGGTITRTLEPGSGLSCSIKVVPGLWEVAVRAYDAEGLRGMGFTTVEAKAGQNTPAQVGMNTTTAVSNWDDLKNAIEHADTENGEYFLVAAELEADSAISVDDHITIIADGHRIINRKTTHTGAFFEVASGGELNLRHGFPGGSLILDGREVPGVSDALVVVSDGDLVMEGNVSLRNNVARGGVGMYGGSFIMNGGTISGNRTTTNGGGVYVNNGIFTMNGGTISNNEAAFGGGVYVLGGGIFNMSQGTVSGNKAGSRGGGVYVGMSGTFTKTGGIIYGDTDTTHTPNSTENTAASGNGHAVYVSSTKKRDSTAGAGINLDSATAGNWDPVPLYMTLYVAQGGTGTTGTETDPFGTVDDALSAIQSAYDASWPGYRSDPAPARIIISGTIAAGGTSNGLVEITETGYNPLYYSYPPVILAGKGTDADAGILDASGLSKRVLYINKADVTLEANLTLTGGSDSSGGGGGVNITGNGRFTMNGGTISDNEATSAGYGGGVYVYNGGSFTMNDGTISNNTAASYGGGVAVYVNSSFEMTGGTISDNTATTYSGGGVYIKNNCSFTMSGGTISGNSALGASSGTGGGIAVDGSDFTMEEGTIKNNSTVNGGGGVDVFNGGSFTMTGGTISGNSVTGASAYGGGVCVDATYSGSFTKTGGIIYGDTDATHTLGSDENTSASERGHAVYVFASFGEAKRNNTAGTEDNLDSTKTAAEGGGWD